MSVSTANNPMARRFVIGAVAVALLSIVGTALANGPMGDTGGSMPSNCQDDLNKCSLGVWPKNSFPHRGVTQSTTFDNGETLTCTSNGPNTHRTCTLSGGGADSGDQGMADNGAGGANGSGQQTANQGGAQYNTSGANSNEPNEKPAPPTERQKLFPTMCDEEGEIGYKKLCDRTIGYYSNYERVCVPGENGGSQWKYTGKSTVVQPYQTCELNPPEEHNYGSVPAVIGNQGDPQAWVKKQEENNRSRGPDEPALPDNPPPPPPGTTGANSNEPGESNDSGQYEQDDGTGRALIKKGQTRPPGDNGAPINPYRSDFPTLCEYEGEIKYKRLCSAELNRFAEFEYVCKEGKWTYTGHRWSAEPPTPC